MHVNPCSFQLALLKCTIECNLSTLSEIFLLFSVVQVLLDQGCMFQERLGWERPGWFAVDSEPEVSGFSFSSHALVACHQ